MREGMRKGIREGIRRGIEEALRIRFHDVPQIIRERISDIEDEGRLRALHRHAILCGSIDEFMKALDERGTR